MTVKLRSADTWPCPLGRSYSILLQQGLADKTFARLRDHIEMLGGEIIRRRYDDPDLAKRPINELLSNLISAKEDRHHQRQM